MDALFLIAILIIFSLLFFLGNRRKNLTEESFISIVNHTFRTPLTRIKWMSETLAQDIPRREQLEIARDVSNSVNRLLEIIDTLSGIRDINSSASYQLRAVSLREILEQAVAKFGIPLTEKKLTIQMPSLQDMPLLSVDTKKITFVIESILENAILYSNKGGSIKIESELKDGYIKLAITDNGIGLTGKDKRNIFDRFYRGERAKKMNIHGMGLGLYISRVIIKRHGGKIHAKSKGKDKGTVFYIKLPSKKG